MKILIIIVMCIFSSTAFGACVSTVTAVTPKADFIDHGDGTVTHSKTGLMWKKCSEGLSGTTCGTGAAITYTWQSGFQAAQVLNQNVGYAGFTDWRLPNIKELTSIVEEQCNNPASNVAIFPVTISNAYWSSTPYALIAASGGTGVWVVNFVTGNIDGSAKNANHYVRLVRGGQ